MCRSFLLAAAALLVPGTALSQGAPTATAPALCTDRPTKATAACTVPKGAFQIETDLLNWTRNDDAGTRSDTILYTNPTIKYGVTDSTDIQATISPYLTARTRDPSGTVSRVNGAGDLFLRIKQRLTDPGAKLQLAIIPFVKVPVAKRGIGNRKFEGGLVGTGQLSLPNGVTLTFTPEIDVLENGKLDGRHVQVVGAFNVGKTLSSKLTAYAELWTAQNYDPAGTVRQYSFDGAVAYLASPKLQFDVGANFGLNRSTPDVQAYVGVSTRF